MLRLHIRRVVARSDYADKNQYQIIFNKNLSKGSDLPMCITVLLSICYNLTDASYVFSLINTFWQMTLFGAIRHIY